MRCGNECGNRISIHFTTGSISLVHHTNSESYSTVQIVGSLMLKVHGHGQTHSCNFCRFKL